MISKEGFYEVGEEIVYHTLDILKVVPAPSFIKHAKLPMTAEVYNIHMCLPNLPLIAYYPSGISRIYYSTPFQKSFGWQSSRYGAIDTLL